MLLTEEQINRLENERNEIGAKLDAERSVLDYYTWIEFKKARKQLEKENKKMEDFDILWGILNKQQIKYVKQNNWGLFRSSRYGMYAIMNAEKRFKDALAMLLEVCYYDINGPNNLSETNPKPLNKTGSEYNEESIKQNWGLFRKPGELDKFLKKYGDALRKENKALEDYYYNRTGSKPLDNELVESFISQPFDLRSGCVYPALVDSIKELKNKLSLKWEDVKNSFIERASHVRMNIMPISPQKAWEILYDDLYDGLE